MIEAYLMHAKSIYGIFVESLKCHFDGNNYKIYIPEKRSMLGYFYNADLNASDSKFHKRDLTNKEKKKLDNKILKGRFVKRLNIPANLLEDLFLSIQNFEDSKSHLEARFEDFRNLLKEKKF